jgi:ATP-binding cassette subfamily C protein
VIACVDQLLVLAEGRVQAFGPKDQVLSRLAPVRSSPQPAPLKIVTGSVP